MDALQSLLYPLPPVSHSHSSNSLYPPDSHHMYTLRSLVRISHQLCSVRFYCNCKKFYHYDLFHVRQNRSYEVGICWLRVKRAHTHSAQQQKYKRKTKKRKYEYGEKTLREKFWGTMQSIIKKPCRHIRLPCECGRRRRICTNLSQSMTKEKDRKRWLGKTNVTEA